MKHNTTNRFQDFFEEEKYTTLKNYLYNYLLRKRAVGKSLKYENAGLILKIGSGISPVVTCSRHIAYSDLSLTALRILRKTHKKGMYVVADATCLPFKNSAFTHAIASEVLEHLRDDRSAIRELARVISPSGRLIVTFPHRKFYFANDDRFVNHYRRYELSEMVDRLSNEALRVIDIYKVLGPLEKLTMNFVVFCFSVIQGISRHRHKTGSGRVPAPWLTKVLVFTFKWANRLYMVLAWLDAKIMPLNLSSVLLIKATKDHDD